MLAFQYDPADATPSSKEQLQQFTGCAAGNVWTGLRTRFDVTSVNPRQRYTDPSTAGSQIVSGLTRDQATAIRQSAVGSVVVAASGVTNGTTTIGELWINYTIKLSKPKFRESATSFSWSKGQAGIVSYPLPPGGIFSYGSGTNFLQSLIPPSAYSKWWGDVSSIISDRKFARYPITLVDDGIIFHRDWSGQIDIRWFMSTVPDSASLPSQAPFMDFLNNYTGVPPTFGTAGYAPHMLLDADESRPLFDVSLSTIHTFYPYDVPGVQQVYFVYTMSAAFPAGRYKWNPNLAIALNVALAGADSTGNCRFCVTKATLVANTRDMLPASY